MPIFIKDLIEKVPREVEVRVRQTRDKARPVLQEALRAECRLVMRTAEEVEENRVGAQVPIEIAPGCPALLEEVNFPDQFEHILRLANYRDTLEKTVQGVTGLIQLRNEYLRMPNPENWIHVKEGELQATLAWATGLLNLIERVDPVRKVLAVRDDILGVYEYDASCFDDRDVNRASIKLYWGVIGLVSEWMGVAVEDLTVVVLAHELAHAYTQLGADIEARRWASHDFSKSELGLKEGLAQYYTFRVLSRLHLRYQGALEVYEALLVNQPDDYKTHLPWIEHHSPESVRRAMIEVRRWKEKELSKFEERLKSAAEQLLPS